MRGRGPGVEAQEDDGLRQARRQLLPRRGLHEIAVDHEHALAFHIEDGGTCLAAGGQHLHGLFVGFFAVDAQDLAQAVAVAVGQDGAVGHGDGDELHVRGAGHLLEQDLQAHARLTAHAGAQHALEGHDQGAAFFGQQARHGAFVAFDGGQGQQRDQQDEDEGRPAQQQTQRGVLLLRQLPVDRTPRWASWVLTKAASLPLGQASAVFLQPQHHSPNHNNQQHRDHGRQADPHMADEPQAHHAKPAGQGGEEELPLVKIEHQRQGRQGGHQPEQHLHAGLLVHQDDLGAGEQHTGDNGHHHRHPAFLLRPGPAQRPHQGDRQHRQADQAQAPQAGIEHHRQVHRLAVTDIEVKIPLVHQHQQHFQHHRAGHPQQCAVEVPVLLAPLGLAFLTLIHV